ncbi:MFS transporter [Fonticella tunisiensis]|uniref:EmrB/QacA subfamily drug resistance transporter n=1 Tax=Fonticella tunisiensis TaxID=1096341 RepID=A0A4R7KCM3_9CLOT|nr:MFS transporter [Fonticella tunisiensis]TDT52059.1 EmrB/QacA subfamily drug resistance transporter [Fonticella tunisiensis]
MEENKDMNNRVPLYETITRGRRIQILIAVAIGTFMGALDSSVVNIALPNITKYFNAPLAAVQWVVMSYLLIISSLLLTYGRMGDMYGHKRIYISGFIIFTIGSVLCGLSPTIGFLIVARAVQALGAGMLMSMGPAIITDISHPKDRGKALGVNAVAVSVALTAGPVLGGFLVSNFDWSSIFYINLPVGIIGILWGIKVIPGRKDIIRQPFDIMGAFVIFIALICILLPLSLVERIGWGVWYIPTLLAAGFIFLILFIFIEKTTEYPMINLKLFRNRQFSMSNISAMLNYMAQYTVVFLMPFYLQQLRGLPASEAGLFMIPMPITTMILAPISGILSDRTDSRILSAVGMGIAAFGIWQLSKLGINSPRLQISLALITTGIGVGLFQTPNNSVIMGSVPGNWRGIASGMLATMRNMGMVLGVAVSGAVFTNRLNALNVELGRLGVTGEALRVQSFTGAMHLTYIIGSLIACFAALTSLIRSSGKNKKTL